MIQDGMSGGGLQARQRIRIPLPASRMVIPWRG
jgi:hypothetical protein